MVWAAESADEMMEEAAEAAELRKVLVLIIESTEATTEEAAASMEERAVFSARARGARQRRAERNFILGVGGLVVWVWVV